MLTAPYHKLHFMGKAELFEKKLGDWFLSSLLGFPAAKGNDLAVVCAIASKF
jgi:hypothetical protein